MGWLRKHLRACCAAKEEEEEGEKGEEKEEASALIDCYGQHRRPVSTVSNRLLLPTPPASANALIGCYCQHRRMRRRRRRRGSTVVSVS